eukprot:1082892-Amphidinium_carterae.1
MEVLTPVEIRQARFEELEKLCDFQALRPYKKILKDAEAISGGIWLTSRWVDSKRKGAPRSRW